MTWTFGTQIWVGFVRGDCGLGRPHKFNRRRDKWTQSLYHRLALPVPTQSASMRHIRDGVADVMLAGGAGVRHLRVGDWRLCGARALSTRAIKSASHRVPYDRDRDSFVMGEEAPPSWYSKNMSQGLLENN